ncbi:MAG: hypothetical protein M1826_006663 [Phylliscum demangeonii]|nr:MAG: hypothetical protein M1826_006663 [Phylliscum demangeonii]
MPTINGVKYACEPCMRGHRSSKCTHSDRILVQVRKPGRPLSSCPHPGGHCSCTGLRMAIPKASNCACGNDSDVGCHADAQASSIVLDNPNRRASTPASVLRSVVAASAAPSDKVRKRGRRPSTSLSTATVKAIQKADSQTLNPSEDQPSIPGPVKAISKENGCLLTTVVPSEPQSESPDNDQTQPAPPPQACSCGANNPSRPQPSPTETGPIASAVSSAVSSAVFSPGNPNPDYQPVAPPNPTQANLSADYPPSEASRRQSYPNPSPNTTLYTFPPKYSTFQKPLTPEELAFLQRNPALFSRTVPYLPSSWAPPSPLPAQYMMTTHSCNCGDSCNCLGCIAHPYNGRTLDFVQSLQVLMATDGQLDDQASRRLSTPGRHLPGMPPLASFEIPNTDIPVYHSHGHATGAWLHEPSKLPPPLPPSIPLSSFDAIGPGQGGLPSQRPPDVSTPMMTANGELVDPHPLSPNAFFHVDYPIGCCASGGTNCLCGDGCTCFNCTLHGRHGGALVEQAAARMTPDPGEPPTAPLRMDRRLSALQRQLPAGLAPPFLPGATVFQRVGL